MMMMMMNLSSTPQERELTANDPKDNLVRAAECFDRKSLSTNPPSGIKDNADITIPSGGCRYDEAIMMAQMDRYRNGGL